MPRPLHLATAALTVTAALLLAACGNGDGKLTDNDALADAGQEGENKNSAPPTDSTRTVAGRPKIELPSDLTYKFEWTKPGDKVRRTAGLLYCEDQRKAHNKSLGTGKTAEAAPPSQDDFVLYRSRLRLNKQGVWITGKTMADRGNAACRA
ncbi:hypothetical protein AB0H82_08975 [Streptomyces sp. NPDC050732]|uniref:hypothetical protein n=1 Tax=Streptomyces sp. NPDC050732 TaxID=3154632 RepID=UPI003415C41B